MPMMHVLATAPVRDGAGIFTLAISLIMIPLGLVYLFNYRGAADTWHQLHSKRPKSPPAGRGFGRFAGGLFVVLGLITITLAIVRFAQGGY
jgi:hypothetical protein